MKCINTAQNKKCKREATKIVEKNDLSNRIAHYCDEHASPFYKYPEDFKIKDASVH